MAFLKNGLLFLFFLVTVSTQAQFGNTEIFEPVEWSTSISKKGDTYEVSIKAIIDEGWHLYSQNEVEAGGPIPTEFSFPNADGNFEVLGSTKEPEGKELFDPVFEMDIKYFEDEVTFTQDIKFINSPIAVEAEVFFMVCDDERCLAPQSVPFVITLDGSKANTPIGNVSPEDIAKSEALDIDVKGFENYEAEDTEESSNLTIFFLGFIGGLIALLTPCVFPMIPLTVSFFTKGAKNRKQGLTNAILYGLFIFVIYLLLSIPFHLLDSLDPEILNNISTNVTLNVIFFIIFIVFALSFFGYFELTLPQSWSAKMDDKANSVGGIIGIFFMALTLAIVSFSCTGPILGSLLGGSLTSDGGAMQLTFGMGGFGLALALPFALFALFPNWLNSLPKSGGWLNTVKVVLGFIEVALAFKFLSNADLVQHWGILKREIFIGIWIIVAIGLALYLFGIIRFPHDGPKKRPHKTRIGLGILTLLFAMYLLPGLTNTAYANLKLLSGFPPPLFYSIYDKETEGPLGLEAFKDFEEGLAQARITNKPILLDFTGWACVNCRKMEEQVWSIPQVYDHIKNDYILISLYVDDDKELEASEQFKYIKPNGSLKTIKTIGNKWATFQTLNFKNNSQPYYVLLDGDLNLLNKPVGYTPNGTEFEAWLAEGLKTFNENSK